jgi:phage terminase Nu1 subunit (DNA packaging protein)
MATRYQISGDPKKELDLKEELDLARVQKTRADAALAEIEVEKARDQLVYADDVRAAWANVLTALRAKLLAIPAKASAQMAAETDKAVIQDYLDTQVRDALEELAAYQPDIDLAGATIGDAVEPARPKESAAVSKAKKTAAIKTGQAKKRGVKPGTARGPYKRKAGRKSKQ